MRKIYIVSVILIAGIALAGLLPGLISRLNEGPVIPESKNFRNGDLIFQSSNSPQALAVQLATHSSYSHCGVLFEEEGKWWVFEAVQPVSRCPLNDWVRRGKEQRYVVKRLKNADKILTTTVLDSMRAMGVRWINKEYDPVFNWSDENLYCSELIWKLYNRTTGIQLGKLEKIRDMDLTSPQVQAVMYNRYGKEIPLNDTVITPVSIFKSPLLKTVFANGKWLE